MWAGKSMWMFMILESKAFSLLPWFVRRVWFSSWSWFLSASHRKMNHTVLTDNLVKSQCSGNFLYKIFNRNSRNIYSTYASGQLGQPKVVWGADWNMILPVSDAFYSECEGPEINNTNTDIDITHKYCHVTLKWPIFFSW